MDKAGTKEAFKNGGTCIHGHPHEQKLATFYAAMGHLPNNL